MGGGRVPQGGRRRPPLSGSAPLGCNPPMPHPYHGVALIADPIHRYIQLTVPDRPGEACEQTLLDTPWMQRLRYIYQLQSARWVYPGAEHSRFQHSLGAMHLAGRFARHLYPGLARHAGDCPSPALVEELLRVAGMVHDLGHGPFAHFFEENHLARFGLTHEAVGARIVTGPLAAVIGEIRRSPEAEFAPGERIDPAWVAWLMSKGGGEAAAAPVPRWVALLKPLLAGIFTADNMDYVLRDSYMCGVAVGPVDVERLIHYTFLSERGLTLHRAGLAALNMFLNARLYLYSNVYFHRTTRAIDLHLREVFPATMAHFWDGNPVEDLEGYLGVTEWSLLEEVRRWVREAAGERRELGREWARILGRDVKWKMAYDTILSTRDVTQQAPRLDPEGLERAIRDRLPPELAGLPFRVDLATKDTRPLNPLQMGDRQIYVFDPTSGRISTAALRDQFDYIPAKILHCRIFALDHAHDVELGEVAARVLAEAGS
ncbi:MAG: HD domain-containing protein [Nitrospirae bacterium]|nr:MAG: HD domain-containing protein [Nitrospirota bacterium]